MKKVLLFITIFILGVCNVKALDTDIESINISSKSDTITVETTNITGNTLIPNIVFNELNDYVTYDVKFKNNTKYTIESIKVNNTSTNVTVTESHKDTLDNPVSITLRYVEETKELSLDNVTLTIMLVDKKGNKEPLEVKIDDSNDKGLNTILTNPDTGMALSVVLSILSISLVGYLYFRYYKNKKNISTMVLILGLLLIPTYKVLADSDTISLIINTENIKVYNNPWEIVSQAEEGRLSAGDELAVDTEHFYVVSSDEDKTVLLSKYNLYVGAIYNTGQHYERTILETEEGYGLQGENAKAMKTGEMQYIGTVPFAGSPYWIDENNKLLSKYGEQENNEPWTNNNIYDSAYIEELPYIDYSHEYDYAFIKSEYYNDYSIALYVEEYVQKLKEKDYQI